MRQLRDAYTPHALIRVFGGDSPKSGVGSCRRGEVWCDCDCECYQRRHYCVCCGVECILPASRLAFKPPRFRHMPSVGQFFGVWLCVWHTVAAWQAGLASPWGYLSWVVCGHPWLWSRACAVCDSTVSQQVLCDGELMYGLCHCFPVRHHASVGSAHCLGFCPAHAQGLAAPSTPHTWAGACAEMPSDSNAFPLNGICLRLFLRGVCLCCCWAMACHCAHHMVQPACVHIYICVPHTHCLAIEPRRRAACRRVVRVHQHAKTTAIQHVCCASIFTTHGQAG